MIPEELQMLFRVSQKQEAENASRRLEARHLADEIHDDVTNDADADAPHAVDPQMPGDYEDLRVTGEDETYIFWRIDPICLTKDGRVNTRRQRYNSFSAWYSHVARCDGCGRWFPHVWAHKNSGVGFDRVTVRARGEWLFEVILCAACIQPAHEVERLVDECEQTQKLIRKTKREIENVQRTENLKGRQHHDDRRIA